jgi:DNA repair protein RadC
MRMKELPSSIRPRERAFRSGVSVLSDAELLAILFRSGRRGLSALELGQKVLHQVQGSLDTLAESPHPPLRALGIGGVQFITLQAAFELGKRRGLREHPIRTKEEALEEVAKDIASSPREVFVLIPLDLRNRCVAPPIQLSKGTRYQVVVDPKDVLHAALSCRAARIVVVHNHPSQDCEPSPQDVLLTKQLMEACAWSDIQFIDHVIVARKSSFSFREKGFLDG